MPTEHTDRARTREFKAYMTDLRVVDALLTKNRESWAASNPELSRIMFPKFRKKALGSHDPSKAVEWVNQQARILSGILGEGVKVENIIGYSLLEDGFTCPHCDQPVFFWFERIQFGLHDGHISLMHFDAAACEESAPKL
jgi:hypothetical protein